MGTYCYTLRKPTTKIDTVDGPIFVPRFEYSYKPSWSYWAETDPAYQRMVGSKLAAAERAFDHHKAIQRREDGTILALDGDFLVRTRRDHYLDGGDLSEIHTEVIGKVVREGRQRILVRTADLSDQFAYPGTGG